MREMEFEIRQAGLSDLPVLKTFEQGIIKEERPFEPHLGPDPITYHDLKGLLDNEAARVALATSQGAPIGCGFARIEEAKDYMQYTAYAYMGLMFVAKAFRGRGVNKAIIDYLESWALEKGVNTFQLEVYGANANAVKAYEKSGYAPTLVEMRKIVKV